MIIAYDQTYVPDFFPGFEFGFGCMYPNPYPNPKTRIFSGETGFFRYKSTRKTFSFRVWVRVHVLKPEPENREKIGYEGLTITQGFTVYAK